MRDAVLGVLNAFQDQKARDAQEDLSFTAVDLFFEVWILLSKLFNINAKLD